MYSAFFCPFPSPKTLVPTRLTSQGRKGKKDRVQQQEKERTIHLNLLFRFNCPFYFARGFRVTYEMKCFLLETEESRDEDDETKISSFSCLSA